MSVKVIDTLKPKNNGTFPVAEAVDIKVTDNLRLDAAYSDIAATIDGYVTPQKFGAVGDGITDDTSAFQSAIASWSKIFIPKGEYKITSRLSIPSGMVITGDGIGTVIKSYDDDGTFLVGDNVIIEKFRVSVENISTAGNVFEISEDSLADCELIVPALNTIINAIDVVWNAEDCTNCAVFSLSCEATFGTHNLTGYYAVRITNCASLSTADKNVGYFVRMYARNGKWITGCEVENCNVYGCRWTYLSGYSDEVSDLSDTATKGCDGLLLNRIQHQCTSNARGLCYIRNGESVNIKNCIPWDWSICSEDAFKNNPFVMPESRYRRSNSVQSKPIEISPMPSSNQFLMLKTDGTFKKLTSTDAYLVFQATGKTELFLPDVAKPMQLGNGENNYAWLYFNGKITTDSYVIKFRLIIDGITSDVTVHMGDSPFDHENIAPYIICDNIPSGVSFVYRCDSYDEFFLYIKKNSGNFTAKDVAISYTIASTGRSYSGISGMSNKIGTINTFNYTADSIYLSEAPSGTTTITDVKTINQDSGYLNLGDGNNNSTWLYFSGKINTDFYVIKMRLVINGETTDISVFMGENPFDHENVAPYIIADRIPSNITFRYRTNQYDEFYLYAYNTGGNFTRKDYAIIDDIAALETSKNKIGTVNVFRFAESQRFESGIPYSTQQITDISQKNEGGNTEKRPTASLQVGEMYFDTTLGKPIFWSGTKWVDSSGTDV